MNSKLKFWTDSKLELLKKLVEVDNLNSTQISIILKTSRNAIIGKVHRLKLIMAGSPKNINNTSKPKNILVKRIKKCNVITIPVILSAEAAKQNARNNLIKSINKNIKVINNPKYKPKKKIRVRLTPEQISEYVKMSVKKDAEIELVDEKIVRLKIPDIPKKGQCKWIDGDIKKGDAYWCCKPIYKESSWCLEHYEDVYGVIIKNGIEYKYGKG